MTFSTDPTTTDWTESEAEDRAREYLAITERRSATLGRIGARIRRAEADGSESEVNALAAEYNAESERYADELADLEAEGMSTSDAQAVLDADRLVAAREAATEDAVLRVATCLKCGESVREGTIDGVGRCEDCSADDAAPGDDGDFDAVPTIDPDHEVIVAIAEDGSAIRGDARDLDQAWERASEAAEAGQTATVDLVRTILQRIDASIASARERADRAEAVSGGRPSRAVSEALDSARTLEFAAELVVESAAEDLGTDMRWVRVAVRSGVEQADADAAARARYA